MTVYGVFEWTDSTEWSNIEGLLKTSYNLTVRQDGFDMDQHIRFNGYGRLIKLCRSFEEADKVFNGRFCPSIFSDELLDNRLFRNIAEGTNDEGEKWKAKSRLAITDVHFGEMEDVFEAEVESLKVIEQIIGLVPIEVK